MKFTLIRAGLASTAIAGVAVLSACGGTTTTAASSSSAASTTATQPAQSSTAASAVKTTTKKTSSAVGSATPGNDPTGIGQTNDCGPVSGPNGDQWQAKAVTTERGYPGCTEVIDVLTDYFAHIDQAEGTAHALTVDGWQCMADTGAQGSGNVGCDKDGLSLMGQH